MRSQRELTRLIMDDIKKRENMTEVEKLQEEVNSLKVSLDYMAKQIEELKNMIHKGHSCKCDNCKHYEEKPPYIPPTQEEIERAERKSWDEYYEHKRMMREWAEDDKRW